MHRMEDIEKVLRKTPVEDVWGIGRRSAPRLHSAGIKTAWDFAQLSEDVVQRRMGINGVRTWRELHSIPSIGFEVCRYNSFELVKLVFGEIILSNNYVVFMDFALWGTIPTCKSHVCFFGIGTVIYNLCGSLAVYTVV